MKEILELKNQWETFKEENPKVRIRDAAKQLATTEAELLFTAVGNTVTRLKNEFQQILKAVESLGKVMALTRNDYCVHERKGVYSNVSFSGPMGLALNPDIDLRLFMFAWSSAFAVDENGRKSLQFFGKDGEAVHKIYLLETSDIQAFDILVQEFTAEDQHADLVWAIPFSLATTWGITIVFFSSRYLDVSVHGVGFPIARNNTPSVY